ncbi:TPA: TadE/TadG family type IV pilus assembly protein, partial [Salmonella enterica subsp. enterica serovar Reading]
MFSINIKNKLRFLVTNERGSALVEVAFVLIPFIVTILFIAELCRVTFISSSLDLVLAESGKIS